MTDEEIEGYQKAEDALDAMGEYEEEDPDEPQTPDYYYCNCCGHDLAKKPGWAACPKCGTTMEERYF